MKALIWLALVGFVAATWMEALYDENEEKLNSLRKATQDYPETERDYNFDFEDNSIVDDFIEDTNDEDDDDNDENDDVVDVTNGQNDEEETTGLSSPLEKLLDPRIRIRPRTMRIPSRRRRKVRRIPFRQRRLHRGRKGRYIFYY